MRLHEFKAKHMRKLALYNPATDREKELKDLLMNKLSYLRKMTLPNLIHTLYLIIEKEDVTQEFKNLCREILDETGNIDFEEDEL